MADNVVITPGTGATIHADEYTHSTLGSGKTQLVKLVDGTLDSSTAIAAGGGVEAVALRVTLANDSTGVVSIDDNNGAITVDGTVAVTNAGITSIDGKITACNTGAVVLAAGTAEVGKLAAGTALIGKVGIDQSTANANEVVIKSGTTAVTNAGTFAVQADITKIAGASVVVSGGSEATALRVTIANDSTGVLSVDDNGGALTVDGSVTVVSGTAANCKVAGTLDAETTKVIGTVNIIGGQTSITAGAGAVAANTPRMTHASDDPVTTALQIIDNTVATEGSAALTSGQQVYGKYDSTLPTAVDDGDAVNILTDKYGRLLIGTDPNIVRVEFSHTDVSTAHEVVAASGSNYVYITSFIISVDTASSYWLEDGDAAAITGIFYLAANGGVSWTCAPGSPLKTKTVNKALNIKSAGTGKVGVTMTYYLAP